MTTLSCFQSVRNKSNNKTSLFPNIFETFVSHKKYFSWTPTKTNYTSSSDRNCSPSYDLCKMHEMRHTQQPVKCLPGYVSSQLYLQHHDFGLCCKVLLQDSASQFYDGRYLNHWMNLPLVSKETKINNS